MVTPLELRNAKREAQVRGGPGTCCNNGLRYTCIGAPLASATDCPAACRRLPQRAVRLALNAIHSSLDAWKVRAASLRHHSLVQAGSLPQAVQPSASTPAPTQAAVSEGKAAATVLTNAALTQLHLPALPLGLLADVPGLRPATAAKLRQQQDDALAALGACLERLQEAVAGLAAAADSLCQLGEKDAAAPVLGEAPVFASLPLRLVAGMLAEVHTMHQTELGIKAAVLRGCQQVVGEFGAALGSCARREAGCLMTACTCTPRIGPPHAQSRTRATSKFTSQCSALQVT